MKDRVLADNAEEVGKICRGSAVLEAMPLQISFTPEKGPLSGRDGKPELGHIVVPKDRLVSPVGSPFGNIAKEALETIDDFELVPDLGLRSALAVRSKPRFRAASLDLADWHDRFPSRLTGALSGEQAEPASPLQCGVRLALRVWIGASAKVVAELEGRRFKSDGACERV